MKKNYFMLAAATMMFAACAETDLVNEVNMEEAPKAIEFESFANKTTRAEITSLADLQTAGFQVWGYKYSKDVENFTWVDLYKDANENLIPVKPEAEGETEPTPAQTATVTYTVFNGVDVSGANWTYTGTQYWDETSKYNFYAVAPKAPKDGVTYSIDKGNITIEGVASAISTASDDYLIAEAVTAVDGATGNTVNFNFSHIMSKVSFKLKAGIDENITVTSLSMSGWNKDTGKFTQNATNEWTFTNTVVNTGTVVLVGTDATQKTIAIDKTNGTAVTDAYIMIPQTIAANTLTFTISYTITRGTGESATTETFTQQVGVVEDVQTWAQNTHTTYTITVGPAEIKFDIATNHNFGWGDDETGSATIQ